MNQLQLTSVSLAFGGLKALSDISLTIKTGDIKGIIGPNGAGKTTLFNVICGIYPLQEGSITLDQKPLRGLSIDEISRLGLARTFQNIRLFKNLSVVENVKIAISSYYNVSSALFRRSSFRQQEEWLIDQAYQLLHNFGLENYARHRASDLPYGLQRRLEITRALATQPKILLLDELACGMNTSEVLQLIDLIQVICQEQSLGILLIDHQMQFVMSLCQHVTVLDFGKIIAEGEPDLVRHNPAVIASYLGAAVC